MFKKFKLSESFRDTLILIGLASVLIGIGVLCIIIIENVTA